jgi:hypothetical protein
MKETAGDVVTNRKPREDVTGQTGPATFTQASTIDDDRFGNEIGCTGVWYMVHG